MTVSGILTVEYRLAGNLFSNHYWIEQENEGACLASCTDVMTAMSAIQTADVEYTSATFRETFGGTATIPLIPPEVNGQAVGATAPSITFLQFLFYPATGRGRVTHRVRGYAANDITDLGSFSVYSTGEGDFDGTSGVGTASTAYSGFELSVVTNTKSADFIDLAGSHRVTIGAKRATRRL